MSETTIHNAKDSPVEPAQPAPTTDIILRLENLSKSFGKNRVLSGINLEVKRGHVLGLMGENGAGKSTMMKCLFGIYSRDEGSIYLDGKIIEFSGPKEALEHGVAMVHQELNQCIDRTVADNMFLGRYPIRFGMIDEAKIKLECNKLFRSLGMAGILYGIGAFLEATRLGLGSAQSGYGYELDAIAACVVGGISFNGGIGKISGAVIGVIIFTGLTYCLNFIGWDTNIQFVIKGVIIMSLP